MLCVTYGRANFNDFYFIYSNHLQNCRDTNPRKKESDEAKYWRKVGLRELNTYYTENFSLLYELSYAYNIFPPFCCRFELIFRSTC